MQCVFSGTDLNAWNQFLVALILVALCRGVIVGLVKRPNLTRWMVIDMFLLPATIAIPGVLLFVLRVQFGFMPIFLLLFVLLSILVIYGLSKKQFTREDIAHICSHVIYDFPRGQVDNSQPLSIADFADFNGSDSRMVRPVFDNAMIQTKLGDIQNEQTCTYSVVAEKSFSPEYRPNHPPETFNFPVETRF